MKNLLWLWLLCPFLLAGQSVEISVLQQNFNDLPDGEEKLYTGIRINRQFANLRECDSVVYWSERVMRIAGSDTNLIHTVRNILRTDLARCNDETDSLVYYGKMAGAYKGANPRIRVEAYRAAYLAETSLGNLKEAVSILQRMYNSAVEVGDTIVILFALNNLSNSSTDLESYDDAVKYRREAIEVARRFSSSQHLFYAYGGLGNLHFTHFHLNDSAIYYYMKALEFSDKVKADAVFPLYINLAASYNEKKDFRTAEVYLAKAEAMLDEASQYFHAGYYNTLGYVQFSQKKFKDAISSYQKSNKLLESGYQDISLQITNTGFISDAYAALEDYENAYKYHFELEQLKDSLREMQTDELLIEKDKQFQTSIAEQKNALLAAKNETNEANIQKQRAIIFAGGLSLVLALLLIIVLYSNFRKKRRNVRLLDKLNAQLTLQRDEILRINHLLKLKVLRTQMNPHFIYNCLNSILNLIQADEKDKAGHYLLTFSKMLRQVLEFSDRQFIGISDEKRFLETYLSLEKLRLGDDFSFRIDVPAELEEDEVMIPSLLIQPFVENAVWHGLSQKPGEKSIAVVFAAGGNDNEVLCRVEDNGIGRRAASKKGAGHKSMGMSITSERLELLNYQAGDDLNLTVKDAEAGGTVVELTLPVKAMEEELKL